ncbi:IS110 family transposase [Thalassotalea euphylliae]|uniref:IS110 family transposase n=1 Tax=Thalassotalea euphylliae TaxID=1655234 RepID=A0A3E0TR56_9GAMM|nr:IS110 family transposase [Thalassotalea euphylliae]REL26968.1 IS110 family transposase [Thalassotalea euphylliae]REL28088.1 IS110 family transposase [Thalassotalea euphylliae]
MSLIKVLGIDLGKSTFHLVGHDHSGREQLRRKFNRKQLLQFLVKHEPVTIAMESCGGSHWLARKLVSFGHQVKLIPPQYVKPYVKTNKNDFIDADAIAEAATRPSMRFVSIKTEEAQVIAVIQRIRASYIKERTACMSRIGAILLEFGMSFPRGHSQMKQLFQWLAEHKASISPMLMLELVEHHEYYTHLNTLIQKQDKKLTELVSKDERAQLLKTIPGVGDLTASRCLSDISNAQDFKNGRHMASWLGLVPHQHSTGGKSTLLGISKRGNKSLRTLFIHGARALMSRPELASKCFGEWLVNLRARKPYNVAVVALANKLARISWSVMVTKQPFKITV